MKYWVIGFTPSTYEVVKKQKTIGVRANVWGRFSTEMQIGDKFVSYVSSRVIFDSIGTITSNARFEEDMLFDQVKFYPSRRKIEFEKINLSVPATKLFNGIAPFNEKNTHAGNYLMIKGGFVEVCKADYDWLVKELTD